MPWADIGLDGRHPCKQAGIKECVHSATRRESHAVQRDLERHCSQFRSPDSAAAAVSCQWPQEFLICELDRWCGAAHRCAVQALCRHGNAAKRTFGIAEVNKTRATGEAHDHLGSTADRPAVGYETVHAERSGAARPREGMALAVINQSHPWHGSGGKARTKKGGVVLTPQADTGYCTGTGAGNRYMVPARTCYVPPHRENKYYTTSPSHDRV